MPAPAVCRLDATEGSGEEYFLPPERLLEGNPRQTVWMHYTEGAGRFMAGIWHSERGRWRIRYTEQEYCRVLEGVSVITDEAGVAVTVRAGEEFVIPAGFEGTWEVVQPTRKRFVIYEPGDGSPSPEAFKK
ncbi:MAG TPA: cupin domain-containing protein [Steroidobacteraceae bacterium]|nr:cupin domain-containing protein [Steroidobacteraceae bacterium]